MAPATPAPFRTRRAVPRRNRSERNQTERAIAGLGIARNTSNASHDISCQPVQNYPLNPPDLPNPGYLAKSVMPFFFDRGIQKLAEGRRGKAGTTVQARHHPRTPTVDRAGTGK